MKTALIGHTGFVGSNLLSQQSFSACYNSKTINEIRGQAFNHVICSGVSAVKWWANQNPEADLAGIRRLMECLDAIRADRFTLISTIDVYGSPLQVSEKNTGSVMSSQPYGANRRMLEEWVSARFPDHHIIRLPALFGKGLKKNIIFDMIHQNREEYINGLSSFQWYPLKRLSSDIEIIKQYSLPIVNLATQPVLTQSICDRFFPDLKIGSADNLLTASYDMWTKYASLFSGGGHYIMDAEEVMDALAEFISAWTDERSIQV
ncbi:NAD-dependent epimerase/dehydratase family protein [Granulibacter bethesdensis]|uniref:NAD-dependent epimerase/dehydratase family protein n=1 Tax=Granulibacter bethesdensis TaxID=364410 RepID=UPI0009332C5A|nr:NAD-dependent epimerase/dehydratase family protein [Granulibacter bethesdensis]